MEARNRSTSSRLGWKIQNVAATREATIDLFDVIGDPWEGTTAKDFVQELRSLDVEKITLNINSPGGYVNDALAMYDAIQQHPAEVTARVIVAASAASFVAQAADNRVITANGKFFIHDAQGIGLGNAADMRALADILDEESNNIAAIYQSRAGGKAEDWRAAMQANDGIGTTYRGQEAVDAGLADEVATAPARNHTPMQAVAQVKNEDPITPEVDPDLFKQITARGYEPPMPSDISRIIERNLAAAKEATTNG